MILTLSFTYYSNILIKFLLCRNYIYWPLSFYFSLSQKPNQESKPSPGVKWNNQPFPPMKKLPIKNYTTPKKSHTSTSSTQAKPGNKNTLLISPTGLKHLKDQSSCTAVTKDPSKCSTKTQDGIMTTSPNNSTVYYSTLNIAISAKAGPSEIKKILLPKKTSSSSPLNKP